MKKLLVDGKTKTVYELGDGTLEIFFKDDMTGEAGKFDPGANSVGLTVQGAGRAGLMLSSFFFEKIADSGYKTHFISSDPEKGTMQVKKGEVFGAGLEVICRYKAIGSFYRRYNSCVKEGQPLGALVEMTLKDDANGDPLINEAAAEMIGVLQKGEYKILADMMQNISNIIKAELAKKNLQLWDIKLEFGKDKNGEIMLIDEISGGNMRVVSYCEDSIAPIELANMMLGLE